MTNDIIEKQLLNKDFPKSDIEDIPIDCSNEFVQRMSLYVW